MRSSQPDYEDLDGRQYVLAGLDAAERRLLAQLRKKARACENSRVAPIQRWCDFDNYWLPKVHAHYLAKGLSRKQITQAVLYRIAQDLSGRIAISFGLARKADYRDRLRETIETGFKSRRAFCKATGLSEDMLSHVLAGRKDLSMEALTNALDRIGYTIRFVPVEDGGAKSA